MAKTISAPLTSEQREYLRSELHKVTLRRYYRDTRIYAKMPERQVDVDSEKWLTLAAQQGRPVSDFDTAKRGERLLAFAEEYRKTHPLATLSQVIEAMTLTSRNGSDRLPPASFNLREVD